MGPEGVLITGGNGGLGTAIGAHFLEKYREVTVVLGVRSNRENAEVLRKAFPERCELVSLDVTNGSEWEAAVAGFEKSGRMIDVLVNNAGHHDDGLLATMSDERWDAVIDSNLRGSFLGARAVIKPMIGQRKGRIINIASLSALLAPLGQTNYAAAKAGVVAMSQSLAKEVARYGITVNSICPGYIDTEALSKMDPDQKKRVRREIPMRRFGKPEEVAAAVAFLASDEAGYITGSVLKMDGGIF